MKLNKIIFSGIFVWLLQLMSADLLAINTVRPDFVVIAVLYWSVKNGRLTGIVSGLLIGLLIDLSGTATFFGLSPLVYTITGYLGGNLFEKNQSVNIIYFTLGWVAIIGVQFLIFCLVRYQNILITNYVLFISKWFGTFFYTICFAGILQLIYPINND